MCLGIEWGSACSNCGGNYGGVLGSLGSAHLPWQTPQPSKHASDRRTRNSHGIFFFSSKLKCPRVPCFIHDHTRKPSADQTACPCGRAFWSKGKFIFTGDPPWWSGCCTLPKQGVHKALETRSGGASLWLGPWAAAGSTPELHKGTPLDEEPAVY